MSAKPKTKAQLKAIFGLAKQRGFANDDLRDLVEDEFGSRSLSGLNFNQANRVIERLGGNAFAAAPPNISRRTLNHRRQMAGIVEEFLTQQQEIKIAELRESRKMSAEGFASLCQHTIKRHAPLTVKDGKKIIEAIKAMNKRDAANRTQPARKAA